MRRSSTQVGTRVFRLPERVDNRALEPVLASLSGAVAGACVLDFRITDHIDFRALRGFARGVSRLETLTRPIVLAGLSPYCEEIVRFALRAMDWDLFLEMEGECTPEAPRGNGVSSESERGRRTIRETDWGAYAALEPHCPN